MKSMLKIILILLLWINGLNAIYGGIGMLHHLHYASWLNDFLLPGTLLLILLGVANIVLTFFVKKHLLLLASCALVQGMCLVFALAEQEEMFRHLQSLSLMLAIEGIALVITAVLLIGVGTAAADPG